LRLAGPNAGLPLRQPILSLNYLLVAHVWRHAGISIRDGASNDANGQDPDAVWRASGDRTPTGLTRAAHVKQQFRDKLIEQRWYVGEHGRDLPEIADRGGPTGQPPLQAI
jgi:phosphoketolase